MYRSPGALCCVGSLGPTQLLSLLVVSLLLRPWRDPWDMTTQDSSSRVGLAGVFAQSARATPRNECCLPISHILAVTVIVQ